MMPIPTRPRTHARCLLRPTAVVLGIALHVLAASGANAARQQYDAPWVCTAGPPVSNVFSLGTLATGDFDEDGLADIVTVGWPSPRLFLGGPGGITRPA